MKDFGGFLVVDRVSFGTDNENGSPFVERILTEFAIMKQRRPVFAYLTAAREASLHHRPTPSLPITVSATAT